MSLPLLGCYAHQGKLFGTIHVACSNIAPRKYPYSSHATAFFHLTPMASPGTPPAIPLKIYQRPGTGALSHLAWQGTGWGVSTGWGQPRGHPPSPHRAGGQLAGRSPLTAPEHAIVILIRPMHIFCSRWQNAQGLPGCQAFC